MRYFVTGATGFIGGRLVRRLLASGHDVVALVREPRRAVELAALGVELAQGDVRNAASLRAPMEGADGVFHVAAWYKVGGGARVRATAEAINVDGTRNVLTAMGDAGVSKGVYTSTLAVFSDTRGARPDETYRYDGPHLSVYDETKARAHYDVAVPMMEAGLPLVIVQPGVVYGPGDTSQMGDLVRDYVAGTSILAPGGTSYCWAHVDDVAGAHVLAMERGVPGETYIIAGPCHTLGEALEIVRRETGRKPFTLWIPPLVSRLFAPVVGLLEKVVRLPTTFSAETMRVTAGTSYLGDNAKARRELGYEPRPLEVGLRETVAEIVAAEADVP